ncbi:hypothetical protein DDW12_09805 [Sulfolobus islandicus]|nr:hypothetical protein DDW12_09805 [Sulfolobus islandicus]
MSKAISLIIVSLFLVSLLFIPLTFSGTQLSFSVSSQWFTSPPYVTPAEKLVQLQVNLEYHGTGNLTNVEIYPIETGPFIVYPFYTNIPSFLNASRSAVFVHIHWKYHT